MTRRTIDRRTAEALRRAAETVYSRLHAYDADGATEMQLLPDYVADEVSTRWPSLTETQRTSVLRIVERLAVAMVEGPR